MEGYLEGEQACRSLFVEKKNKCIVLAMELRFVYNLHICPYEQDGELSKQKIG